MAEGRQCSKCGRFLEATLADCPACLLNLALGAESDPGTTAGAAAEIAERVAASEDLDHVVTVELLTSTFDSVRYCEDGPEPLRRDLHHRCEVSR